MRARERDLGAEEGEERDVAVVVVVDGGDAVEEGWGGEVVDELLVALSVVLDLLGAEEECPGSLDCCPWRFRGRAICFLLGNLCQSKIETFDWKWWRWKYKKGLLATVELCLNYSPLEDMCAMYGLRERERENKVNKKKVPTRRVHGVSTLLVLPHTPHQFRLQQQQQHALTTAAGQ